MKNPKPKDFIDVVVATVNAMRLPYWYSREEGYSIAMLEVIEKFGDYRKKCGKCSLKTFVKRRTKWAVLDEVRKLTKRRVRHVHLSDFTWSSLPDWRSNDGTQEENSEEDVNGVAG